MMIDAHQHYWKLDRGDYDWLTPEMGVLYRDFLPQDLIPHLAAEGIRGSILVQAAQTEAETRFLLDLAKSEASILGVVGWVDMQASDVGESIDRLIDYGDGYLKGIRPMIQDIPDPNWVLEKNLDRAFEALIMRDLVFDALVRPIHLKNLEARLRQHPGLKSVIDHGAKPCIANHERSAWSEAMGSIARNTTAFCKLSGLVTEAASDCRTRDIKPYVSDLIYRFGPDRLIWGSDWPVLNLASDYKSWLQLARQFCEPLTREEKDRVFGRNADDLYGLGILCLQ